MGVAVQLLRSEQHRMAVFSAMLVGTVCGVAVLGTTLISLARRTNNSQPTQRRQRASVTEVLNVDMVDHGLCFTATNIDCSLDMELQDTSRGGVRPGSSSPRWVQGCVLLSLVGEGGRGGGEG